MKRIDVLLAQADSAAAASAAAAGATAGGGAPAVGFDHFITRGFLCANPASIAYWHHRA